MRFGGLINGLMENRFKLIWLSAFLDAPIKHNVKLCMEILAGGHYKLEGIIKN